jgi:TRAP-type C4-dicarboxylate transport system substrate-binding protein
MNGAKWDALGDADKAAIEAIAGEELSAAWGRAFDARDPAAEQALAAKGHTIAAPSPELLAKVDGIRDDMIADWIEAAKAAGVADPAAMLAFYRETYQSLAVE